MVYVHFVSEGRACQKAQYAFADGVTAHVSFCGVGSPSMRHTNPSPYWVVPALVNPAACSAVSPLPGCPVAQPRSMWPPEKPVKSTITVTPDVVLHAGDEVAPTGTAGATTAEIAIAAPMVALPNISAIASGQPVHPVQHGVSGTIVDAEFLATGNVLLAIAGTACTVANTLAVVLPGKKKAP